MLLCGYHSISNGKPPDEILCGEPGCSNLLFELPSLIVYTPEMSSILYEGIEETGSSERPGAWLRLPGCVDGLDSDIQQRKFVRVVAVSLPWYVKWRHLMTDRKESRR